MKSLVRVGLLTSLIFMGWTYNQASADTNMIFATKCGTVPQSGNPSATQINCLLTNAALEEDIPPEVVKAVAAQESGWKQFDETGKPYQSSDGGIGIMQIQAAEQPSYDPQKLQSNIVYNIEAGVEILSGMYDRTSLQSTNPAVLPKIKDAGRDVIENWYFPVMAYNGTKPVNSPLYQANGTKNANAYQEKVFALLEKESFLGDTPLGQYHFSTADFSYPTDSDQNIKFNKLDYSLSDQMHASNFSFTTGDHVVVTDNVNLRAAPTSSSNATKLAKNTSLLITGSFVYDETNSANQFVWYPVKTETGTLKGYIASAYITKKLAAPLVNPVDDNDMTMAGTAPAYAQVRVMNGSSLVGNGLSDGMGHFKLGIKPQKAGTKLTVTYLNNLNATSLSTTVSVADKTAPAAPSVNAVKNTATAVTGKTEAHASVTVTIAGKTYNSKADGYGSFKVGIPVQNTGTHVSVTSKDTVGNVSVARNVTVVRAAPNMPSVNTVSNKAISVTGKTEAFDRVTVTISGKNDSAKADRYGNFRVKIPVLNSGTRLTVMAIDSMGHISSPRKITVVRVAPNRPTVNTVKYYSTSVTGKTEKYDRVTVKIGSRTYTSKATVSGNFKVSIPKQKAGTKLYVSAKDAKGKVSATRTVTVLK